MHKAQLTPRQIRILLVGHSAGALGRGFVNESEELAAWFAHRETLLAGAGSARPYAYLKFELCEDVPQWIHTAESLFRRKPCFEQGAPNAETNAPTMAEDQPPELWKELETPASIRALEPDLQDLERLLREFGFAQAWHAFRGRPSLVEKYARIGAAIRAVLRDSLTILKPKAEEN
jgi:hypothetical protein